MKLHKIVLIYSDLLDGEYRFRKAAWRRNFCTSLSHKDVNRNWLHRGANEDDKLVLKVML